MKVGQYKDDEKRSYRDSRALDRASSNSFDKIMDGEDDDDSVTETSAMVEEQPERNNGNTMKRILCCSGILLLLGGVGVGSYFLAKHLMSEKQNINTTLSSSTATASNPTATTPGFCQPDIGDIHEPLLELHVNAGHLAHFDDSRLDSEQIKLLEHAVTDGYNAASGGCTDVFERFMVGSLLKSHNVTENVDGENENGFTVEFSGMKTLILNLETVISCQGCPDDEAFATNYPSTYASADSITNNSTRRLMEDPLDAGVIIEEIEKRIKEVLPELGDVTDVSIRTNGNNMATMKLRGSSGVSIYIKMHGNYFTFEHDTHSLLSFEPNSSV